MMKFAFFDAKPYDKPSFERYGAIGGVYMSCSGPQLLQGFTVTGCYSAGTSKGIQSGPAFCSKTIASSRS